MSNSKRSRLDTKTVDAITQNFQQNLTRQGYLVDLVKADETGLILKLSAPDNQNHVNGAGNYLELSSVVLELVLNQHCLIQEKEQAEQRLRQQITELEAEKEAADVFVRTVAHSLQAHIGGIISWADALREYYQTMTDDELKIYLQRLGLSGRKLSLVVDELLLLSGVRHQAVTFDPLDLEAIVGEARRRLAYMIEISQTQIISPDVWPIVLGHGPWVEEVWINYLSNAMKYGGRPPRIELGAATQAGGMVRCWVHDNGPGLTPEQQNRLFEPFTRLNQTKVEGYGLGLSVVRTIVEKLGGQVGVDSDGVPGRGSTFFFTLPGGVG